jgi:hypothetical protein
MNNRIGNLRGTAEEALRVPCSMVCCGTQAGEESLKYS